MNGTVSSPAPEDRVDIATRADVELLVRSFYRDAATDGLLGPIFAGMDVDWPTHIALLTDFWEWQLLGGHAYEGNPLRAHEPVHERFPFTPAHFIRWLELFTATLDTHFTGPTATAARQRAVKMAGALERILTAPPSELRLHPEAPPP